jgi:hypothetical protein
MPDIKRVAIAFATFVIIVAFVFILSFLSIVWIYAKCSHPNGAEAILCNFANLSYNSSCVFLIIGAIVSGIVYFTLPGQSTEQIEIGKR